MSAQASTPRKEFKHFTPEERASFLSWRFGATLDWCSLILREINYPVAELRWFVDAVQGLCKGQEMRIAHSTLAKRAQRFMNKTQARELAKRAIDTDRFWSRARRCMVFDIERPKPGEMEGKNKRARTKYTDYLTPAAVFAQETEHKVKKSDEVRWKRDGKYRLEKRQEIMAEALKMLPQFERVEDMPPGTAPKESTPLPLSKYIEQREKILLTENRRILDRIFEGELIDVGEIDARLASLEVFHEKAIQEIDQSYKSMRDALLGLKKTRLQRAMDFTDPQEAVAEVDQILEARTIEKWYADVPPTWLEETFQEIEQRPGPETQKGYAGVPPETTPPHGNPSTKGYVGVPLSVPAEGATSEPQKGYADVPPTTSAGPAPGADDADPEMDEFVIGDAPEEAAKADAPLTQLDCALSYAALGLPVFPTKPDKSPYTARGFKEATTDEKTIRAWWRKHPDAGIGIPTGRASGLLVLDRDDRHGGDASLSALVEKHGDLPPTQQAATPSGGAHYAFKYPEGTHIGNSAGKLGKGLDVRGEGGYIVAPGRDPARRWVNALDPADAPEWMIELLLSEKHEPVNTDRQVIHYPFAGARYFEDGERNNGLRDVMCGRWTNGFARDPLALYEQMREVRDTRCAPGKDPAATDAELWEMVKRTTQKFPRGDLREGGAA